MKKNCNTSCDGFSPGPDGDQSRKMRARELAQSERGRYDSPGEDNFVHNHSSARARIPLRYSPRLPKFHINHLPRRMCRPDDDIFTARGRRGRKIRAQLPLEEPHTERNTLLTNPSSSASSLPHATLGPLRGWIGNVDQTADTPLAPLSTNSPVETSAARSTVYAFLTSHSF